MGKKYGNKLLNHTNICEYYEEERVINNIPNLIIIPKKKTKFGENKNGT